MSELADAAKSGGRSMTLFGIATLILGILAMLAPMLTGFSIAMLVGIFVIAGGIARMFWAFQAESFGKGLLAFALGGLTLLAGVVMVANPLFAAGLLTILLAAYFIVDGAFEIFAAFKVRPESGWGWLLFGGVASLVLGVMIWRQYPLSGVWAIGILLGIKLFFAGIMMMTVGGAARRVGKAADQMAAGV